MDKLHFFSLASGSSGNCYFVGNARHGILIDAGIGIRSIRNKLKDFGYKLENILAVFITHDHFDHIRSVGMLGEKYKLPIYSTEKILDGVNRNYAVTKKIYSCKRNIEKEVPTTIADFKITAFPISHDATESLGYIVEYQGKKIVLATDLGFICESASKHLREANYMVIEANYDMEMLSSSHYPEFLKERIYSEKGHLCNDDTANFLEQNYGKHLHSVYLCHLSKQNNTPEKAYETIKKALEKAGAKVGENVQLVVLPRAKSSDVYVF